jgi:hypothetical protein
MQCMSFIQSTFSCSSSSTLASCLSPVPVARCPGIATGSGPDISSVRVAGLVRSVHGQDGVDPASGLGEEECWDMLCSPADCPDSRPVTISSPVVRTRLHTAPQAPELTEPVASQLPPLSPPPRVWTSPASPLSALCSLLSSAQTVFG